MPGKCPAWRGGWWTMIALQCVLVLGTIIYFGGSRPTLKDALLLYYFGQFLAAQFKRLE